MRTKFLVIFMGFLAFLFGSCSKPQPAQSPAKPPPEITADSEIAGFVDLTFAIHSKETISDGAQALRAYGVHRGREVGIAIVLGAQWKKGTLGPNTALTTYQGTVTYRSLGTPSDAFLQVLDQLYDTKLRPTTIRPNTIFTGISLAGEPADLMKGPARIKLFFESGAEDRYAELYTNIDLSKGLLQIHEKDPEYRSAIIRALRSE